METFYNSRNFSHCGKVADEFPACTAVSGPCTTTLYNDVQLYNLKLARVQPPPAAAQLHVQYWGKVWQMTSGSKLARSSPELAAEHVPWS